MSSNLDDFVGIEEAVKLKGLTRVTILRLLHSKEIIGRKLPKAWIIDKGSLMDYKPKRGWGPRQKKKDGFIFPPSSADRIKTEEG